MNLSFIMKASQNLWVKVMISTYKSEKDIIPKIQVEKQGSNFWKGVYKGWGKVNSNIIWRAGNGESVNFLSDPWIPPEEKPTYCYKPNFFFN